MVRPGPRAVGRDVRPDEERFPVPERDVGVLELGAPFPQRLDLRPGQDETRLRAILDEEIVKRLAVRRHSLDCGSARGGQRLLFRHERGSLPALRACAVSAPSAHRRATRPVAASIARLTPRRRFATAARGSSLRLLGRLIAPRPGLPLAPWERGGVRAPMPPRKFPRSLYVACAPRRCGNRATEPGRGPRGPDRSNSLKTNLMACRRRVGETWHRSCGKSEQFEISNDSAHHSFDRGDRPAFRSSRARAFPAGAAGPWTRLRETRSSRFSNSGAPQDRKSVV